MNFDDIVKGTNVDANEVTMQEGYKALARVYRWSRDGFIAEGFDNFEANELAYRIYVDYLSGRMKP